MLPLVITVEQVDGGIRRYAFADSPVSIGRSPFAELQLSEPFISRWEGTLRFDAGEMTYFSLGSTNATYVNGQPLPQCEDDIPLKIDSVLTLGDLKLRFAREPVAESDLRRKGKRGPTLANTATGLKTQYLDARALLRPPQAPDGAVSGGAPAAPSAPAAAPGAANGAASYRTPVPAAANGPANGGAFAVVVPRRSVTIAPQSCIVLAEQPSAAPRPPSTPPLARTVLEIDVAAVQAEFARERAAAGGAAAPLSGNGPSVPSSFTALRQTYHEARAALIADIRAQLETMPQAERIDFLTWLPRREPSLASDPDLQLELQRAGVVSPGEIPELRDWMRAISPELVPDGVPFDSQLALTRVLGLLEVLIQSLAEIHDAQESVRRRWLGRSARRSILQSDDGNVVLAYLLDPRADWNERLRELEQNVRDVVTHELALFRATLDGARTLVDTLAPSVIASSADADGLDPSTPDSTPGFWTRLLCKDAGDIGLWRRFQALYGELTDGARYERIFLGRVFSRSYLAAMGRSEPARG